MTTYFNIYLISIISNITSHASGQIITTSADVTLNGGLIRELPQNPLNSGLGIILICPDACLSISKWVVVSCSSCTLD